MMFSSISGHSQWSIGELVVFGMSWLNADSVSTRPVFSTNNRTYQPGCGGTIVQCDLSAFLIPHSSGEVKHLLAYVVSMHI